MKTKSNALKTLRSDIKHVASANDNDNQRFVIISDLYLERFNIYEREDKVMLEKLISATQGKTLVFENNSKSLG